VPGIEPEHVRVDEPGDGGRVTLLGVTEQLRAEGAEAERLTLPANPFSPATLIVELPGELGSMVRLVGLADREKSAKENVAVVV